MSYVDMTEKWSRAMELLKQPPAAGAARRVYRPSPALRWAAAFLSGVVLGLILGGLPGLG